tara:strand:- start:2902 stop:3759 length:858 start_codon:yes stop_codon:yes gene_type:complete
MSLVQVQGNVSGTGTLTIAAPNTNSNYTLTLPQTTGTLMAGNQIQSISASVSSSALTISASALSLDFRSTTLGSGTVTTASGTPANLVISSGSTLGTVSAVASRIVVIALNNAGTIELAAVNISGGTQLDETNLISTTAEGGGGAADSASVVYSTTARTSVAYRVIGFIDSTQATAGTWATAPSTIQGVGGQALAALSSLGFNQLWQNVTRTTGVTYYNTTGKPIYTAVFLAVSSNVALFVNGVTVNQTVTVATTQTHVGGIVPAGASYNYTTNSGSYSSPVELR